MSGYTTELLERAIAILEQSPEPMSPAKLARLTLNRKISRNCTASFMKALGAYNTQVWQDDIQIGNKPRQLTGLAYRHGLEDEL